MSMRKLEMRVLWLPAINLPLGAYHRHREKLRP